MATTKVTGDLIADATLTRDNIVDAAADGGFGHTLDAFTSTADAISVDVPLTTGQNVTFNGDIVLFENGLLDFTSSEHVSFGTAAVDLTGDGVHLPAEIYNQFTWEEGDEFGTNVTLNASDNLRADLHATTRNAGDWVINYNTSSSVLRINFDADYTDVIKVGYEVSLLLNDGGTAEANGPIFAEITSVRAQSNGRSYINAHVYFDDRRDGTVNGWTSTSLAAAAGRISIDTNGNTEFFALTNVTTLNIIGVVSEAYFITDHAVQGWQDDGVADGTVTCVKNVRIVGDISSNGFDLSASSGTLNQDATARINDDFQVYSTRDPLGNGQNHTQLEYNTDEPSFIHMERRGDLVTLWGRLRFQDTVSGDNAHFSIATIVGNDGLPIPRFAAYGTFVQDGGAQHAFEVVRIGNVYTQGNGSTAGTFDFASHTAIIPTESSTDSDNTYEITADSVGFRIGETDQSGFLSASDLGSVNGRFQVTYIV